MADSNEPLKPLRLLALDGGGVRGLSELLILKRLMHHIRPQTKDQELPKPCEYFDVIYGTSTGGLIAIMLGRLELDVDTCIRWWCKLSQRIFPERSDNVFANIKKYWAAYRSKEWFDSEALEDCMKDVISSVLGRDHVNENLEGANTQCKIAVCVTRGENRAAAFLRSYGSRIDTLRHCTIWEAARATSAAPLFFAPIKIGDLGSIYADGGITNNNPVFAMHTQVNKDPVFGIANHPRPKSIIACIVSIGTGKMETKGLGSDLKAVIEACVDMATETENKAKLFADEHQDMVQSQRYFRFNVEQGMQGIGLEEGKKLNLMEAATDEYLDGIIGQLRDCAALLSNPTPPPYNVKLLNSPYLISGSLRHEVSPRELRLWLDILPEYDRLWERLKDARQQTLRQMQGDFATHLSNRYDDTCEWIFRRPEYLRWLDMPERKSLWLQGIPGCGKSVLAAAVAKRHDISKPKIVFFCDSKDQTKASAGGVLRNLLAQLIDHNSEQSMQLVAHEYRRSGQALIASLDDLRKLFSRTIELFEEVVIVVDALDELDNFGLDTVTDLLNRLQNLEKASIKIFVTSRNDPRLLDSDCLSFCDEKILLNKTDVDGDLKIFVHRSLSRSDEITGLLGGNRDWFTEIKDNLLEHCEGQFLLPKYIIEEIQTLQTMSQIREALRKTPRTLRAYYADFFQRIPADHRAFARVAFRWLAYLQTPLSLRDLAQALEHNEAFGTKTPLLNLELSLKRSCGCLILLEGGMIRLSHSSVQDILIDGKDILAAQGLNDFVFEAELVHAEIASTCFAYMTDHRFTNPLSGRVRFHRSVGVNFRDVYPFLLYSTRYWGSHFRASKQFGVSLLPRLMNFVSSIGSRCWMEAIYLSTQYPRPPVEKTVDMLSEWLREQTAPGDTFSLSSLVRWIDHVWLVSTEFFPVCSGFPSEVHFIREILPDTSLPLGLPTQFVTPQLKPPETMMIRSKQSVSKLEFNLQLGHSHSDRFTWDGEFFLDWNSTMTSIHRHTAMNWDFPERWHLYMRNHSTGQKDRSWSYRPCFVGRVCASAAVASETQQAAMAWPDIEDDRETQLPLKIKTYGWKLRRGHRDVPMVQKWDWTDDEYGADYTRAAAFEGSKNLIAFSDEGTVLVTPGGFYDIQSGARSAPPAVFSDANFHGLTFSKDGYFAWGRRDLSACIRYCRRTGTLQTFENAGWETFELCGVAASGKFAVVMSKYPVTDKENRICALGVTLWNGETISFWSKERDVPAKDDKDDGNTDEKGIQGGRDSEISANNLKDKYDPEEDQRLFNLLHSAFRNGGFVDTTTAGHLVVGWPGKPLTMFVGKVSEDGTAIELEIQEYETPLPNELKPLSLVISLPDVLVATSSTHIVSFDVFSPVEAISRQDQEQTVQKKLHSRINEPLMQDFVVSELDQSGADLVLCTQSQCITYTEGTGSMSRPARVYTFSKPAGRVFQRIQCHWLSADLPSLNKHSHDTVVGKVEASRFFGSRALLTVLDKLEMWSIINRFEIAFERCCHKAAPSGTIYAKAVNFVIDRSYKRVSLQSLAILRPSHRDDKNYDEDNEFENYAAIIVLVVFVFDADTSIDTIFMKREKLYWYTLMGLKMHCSFAPDSKSLLFSFGGVVRHLSGLQYYGRAFLCSFEDSPKKSRKVSMSTRLKKTISPLNNTWAGNQFAQELSELGAMIRPINFHDFIQTSSGTKILAFEYQGTLPWWAFFLESRDPQKWMRINFEAMFKGDCLFKGFKLLSDRETLELYVIDKHATLSVVRFMINSPEIAHARRVASIALTDTDKFPKFRVNMLEDGSTRVIGYGNTLLRSSDQQHFTEQVPDDAWPLVITVPGQCLGEWESFSTNVEYSDSKASVEEKGKGGEDETR